MKEGNASYSIPFINILFPSCFPQLCGINIDVKIIFSWSLLPSKILVTEKEKPGFYQKNKYKKKSPKWFQNFFVMFPQSQ